MKHTDFSMNYTKKDSNSKSRMTVNSQPATVN